MNIYLLPEEKKMFADFWEQINREQDKFGASRLTENETWRFILRLAVKTIRRINEETIDT